MTAKKLNLLFLNSIEPSVWGGLENWMEMTTVELTRRGHHAAVIGRPASKFVQRLGRHAGLDVRGVSLSGDFNPVAVYNLARVIRSCGIEITIANFVRDVRLAAMARFFTGPFRIVWTPGVKLARKTWSHKFLFSRFVDRVMVPSRRLADEIISVGFLPPSLFDVIPIGLDEQVWKMGNDDDRRRLRRRFGLPEKMFVCLTSGRFVPQKGHIHLIEAARQLAAKHDDIYFLFLGDGPLEGELKVRVDEYGLQEKVIFGGWLEDHRSLVAGADLCVHPALIEPFGIVLVEAMACGLPVVATRVGGIPEVVAENETALLVDPGDAAQLTSAITRAYTDAGLRDRFGRAGRNRFEQYFRLEAMIDKIEKSLIDTVEK